MTVGTERVFAITVGRALWGWGSNLGGQVGDGTTTDQSSPVRVGTSTGWASVSSGDSATVAMRP